MNRLVALHILALQLIPPYYAYAAPPFPLLFVLYWGARSGSRDAPDFGPNVMIFDPKMPLSQIQTAVDAIANQQISNQFGPQRYALLFMPGTYGTSDTPLNFQVGHYTAVAGLGFSPNDVVINGSIDVYNQCDASGSCVALNNFWRSLSNLTINVTNPTFGCHTGEFWAVSQAAPMRRVHINDNGLVATTLMDYCTGPSFASGGFIADSEFDGKPVLNGSQQQFFVRNSSIGGWTNGVWNQVFSGVVGAPATCFPAQPNVCGPYTTLATSPVTREAPFLYMDSNGNYNVFVPSVQNNSVGTTWGAGATPGSSIRIEKFFVAKPTDSAATINEALGSGMNLILTPGVYNLDQTIEVTRPDTVVLGLGFPTLIPENGIVFKVANTVTSFSGYGMGSYSFFNQGVNIYAANAFEVPTTLPASSLHDLLTIFLNATTGMGGILNVINNTGGSSTSANPDTPITVVSYP